MTDRPEYQVITSPCVGICRLDDNKVCIGCFRSSDEITYWRTYTEEEREVIREKLVTRSKEALKNI